jgi:mono/diheme cytochrome c family protein
MTTIITKGKGKMPASKLTADQAKEMVAYIRSLK